MKFLKFMLAIWILLLTALSVPAALIWVVIYLGMTYSWLYCLSFIVIMPSVLWYLMEFYPQTKIAEYLSELLEDE